MNRDKQYKEIWFRGLSEEDKDILKRQLSNSILIDRLKEIISEWERETPVKKTDYDSPSWACKQAHLNGMAEILARLKSLIPTVE